jgi:hypothetical protein
MSTIKREVREITSFEDGSIYQGEWDAKLNVKDGRGILIWPDASRYDG